MPIDSTALLISGARLWRRATIRAKARFRRLMEKYCWCLCRAVPVRDETGNILQWYGTTTDIEDFKRAEALLAGEKQLLEMIARDESLALILDALCRLVEDLSSGSRRRFYC